MGSATKESELILYTPLLKIVIQHAYNKSHDEGDDMNEIHLLHSLLNESDGIALRIATNMGVNLKEITKEIEKPIIANELGINLNKTVENEEILLREKELNEVMQILLRRNKNNPLLIGKSGVGKTAVVEELARRMKNGNLPTPLKNKEIILINTSSLIAGTKYRGEFEERVNNLVKEVIGNKNTIIFIDEIHNIVKTGSSDGSVDAANILKPYLARGELSIIGATTTEEYNEYIKKDSALTRRFSAVMINEPSLVDMKYILSKIKKKFEKFYDLSISKKTIEYLINQCDIYLPNSCNPDKCIDILDTTCSKKILADYQIGSNKKEITPYDIYEVITSRINLKTHSKEQIEALKAELSGFNDQIVKNMINIIRDPKSNKYMVLTGSESNKKEELIKRIANRLNINLINIDCNEYNDDYSLSKLLGNNYLYNQISDNPYSIIIFNNYHNCNKILYNLINTMKTSGYITNNKNEKLNLNNIVIFLLDNESTGNIGFNNDERIFAN